MTYQTSTDNLQACLPSPGCAAISPTYKEAITPLAIEWLREGIAKDVTQARKNREKRAEVVSKLQCIGNATCDIPRTKELQRELSFLYRDRDDHRDCSRHRLLAYGFLKGTPYLQIEACYRPAPRPYLPLQSKKPSQDHILAHLPKGDLGWEGKLREWLAPDLAAQYIEKVPSYRMKKRGRRDPSPTAAQRAAEEGAKKAQVTARSSRKLGRKALAYIREHALPKPQISWGLGGGLMFSWSFEDLHLALELGVGGRVDYEAELFAQGKTVSFDEDLSLADALARARDLLHIEEAA